MEKEFLDIIDNNNRILYKICRSFTVHDSDFEDLHQEMLIQLWKSFPKFKGDSKVTTWMYKVALNTAITFKKKHKNGINTVDYFKELNQIPDSFQNTLNEEERGKLRIKLLYKCIHMLKENERALVLLNLEGLSQKEISEITGLTSNNVGVKFMRAKKKLHNLLKENGYERI